MKTINVVTSLVSSFIFLFSFNTVHADVCVRPTPPVTNSCYKTVTTENQVDQDSRYIYIEKVTKQVDMNCGPSSDQIKYEADMVSYNVCLQVNELKTRNSQHSNTQSQYTNQDTNTYKRVCPLPTQPTTQASQPVITTAEFGNGTTIKQYADGTYAIFNVVGQYEGTANSTMFNNAKNYQTYMNKIAEAVSLNNLDNVRNLTEGARMMESLGESVQLSIDKRLANKDNCPSPKLTCPLNSTLDESQSNCGCDEGYANDGNDQCETMTKWCLDNFGSDYYYDGTGNHIGACKIKKIQNNIVTSPIPLKDIKNKTVKIRSSVTKSIVKPTSTMSNFATGSTIDQINSLDTVTSNQNKIATIRESNTWKRRVANFFTSLFGR